MTAGGVRGALRHGRGRGLVGLAVAAACLGAPALAQAHARVGGIVADIPTGAHVKLPPVAHAANLSYGGGRVLHWNRTHLIFWAPAGSGLRFDSGYQAHIARFLSAVAADSHRPSNVYSLSGQYTDAGGPAAYDSIYGGAVLDTDPLPPSGCQETAPPHGPGWAYCVTDAQVQQELSEISATRNLAASANDVYFVVLPDGLGECTDAGSSSCALGGRPNGYCGYHSETVDGLLYAVIPYNAVPGHCQSANPRPNHSTADPAISTISHEQNEMVTDPDEDAWIDAFGNEVGDLCITAYGPRLGGPGGSTWDETIHGGHYWLQEEWSNMDGACRPRARLDLAYFTLPSPVSAGRSVSLTGQGTDRNGPIVTYTWFFGDGGHGHRRVVSHQYHSARSYRIILRTTDSLGLWAYGARIVKVQASGGKAHRPGAGGRSG